jgi:phage shock protein C
MVGVHDNRHAENMTQTASNNPLAYSSSHGLYRSRTNRRIKGVCGGIAERFGLDPSIVRIAFVLGTLFLMSTLTGWAMFGYVIAALAIHERPATPAVIDVNPFSS